jgi:hypothetical protein
MVKKAVESTLPKPYRGIAVQGKNVLVVMKEGSPFEATAPKVESLIVAPEQCKAAAAPNCWAQVLSCGPDVPDAVKTARYIVFAPTSGFRVTPPTMGEGNNREYRIISTDSVAAVILASN